MAVEQMTGQPLDQRAERNVVGDVNSEQPLGRRSPSELLAVVSYKLERMDRDLQGIRTDIERSRLDFREEMRAKYVEFERRMGGIEQDIDRRIVKLETGSVDPARYTIVEKLVFGLVGIILVAITYSIIAGHQAIPPLGGGH